MTYLLDTSVLIHLRDDDGSQVFRRAEQLLDEAAMSILSEVELEGGIQTVPDLAAFRRIATDELLYAMPILPLSPAIVRVYAGIIAARGFSRPRIIGRLIAATAIINDLTLITVNGDDFRDVPDLRLEVWPAP